MGKRTKVVAVSSTALVVSVLSLVPSLTRAKAATAQQSSQASEAFYTAHVAPVLQENCLRCHGGMNHRGGFSMSSRDGFLKGGKSGPAIVPGHPEQSLMIQLVRQENLGPDQKPMPPRGKLSSADIATLEEWIRAGAVMPAAQ